MPPPRSKAGPPRSGSAPAAETRSAGPIGERELPGLLGGLEGLSCAILAVSGGGDSLALMILADRWRRLTGSPPRLSVATVDHGLRPEAAEEARFVAEAAARLGLPHATLVWTGSKPRVGIPAAARDARYRLLLGEARRIGADAVVTAHTEGDQAETLLMRLARGSGLDGLAAIAPETRLGGDVRLLRPLLGVARERLEATLLAAGETWIEDPTNMSLAQERVRLRRASAALADAGLSSRALARTAWRLQRARRAIEAGTAALGRSAMVVHPAGYAELDLLALRQAPEELALRLLGRAISCIGGASEPARLSRLEAAACRLLHPDASRATLGGCRLVPRAGRLLVFREPGRGRMPALVLEPGASAVWDRRFAVARDAGEGGPLTVRAPTAQEARRLRETCPIDPLPPREALLAAPVVLDGEAIVAAPFAGRDVPGVRIRFLRPSGLAV